jgi:hypothetical protein
VLALPAPEAQAARERCEALGLPTYQAATFVEMHFAGVPAVEPAAEPLS